MRFDVALVSCLNLPEPDPDAAVLVAALDAAGIRARTLAWDDPAARWSSASIALLRSCWNYPWHVERFRAWVRATARVTELLNSPDTVLWNLHKGYLLELERAGLRVAPTELVARAGALPTLASIMRRRGFAEVVIKPAVSAASWMTRCFDRDSIDSGEAHLRDVLTGGDALVQRYLPAVEDHGERALVWIDGAITHAVRKRPRWHGEEEAVSPEAVPATPAEQELGRRAVERVATRPLYARIDLAPGPRGEPVLMELELIEPSLFFAQGPAALERLVAALAERLRALRRQGPAGDPPPPFP